MAVASGPISNDDHIWLGLKIGYFWGIRVPQNSMVFLILFPLDRTHDPIFIGSIPILGGEMTIFKRLNAVKIHVNSPGFFSTHPHLWFENPAGGPFPRSMSFFSGDDDAFLDIDSITVNLMASAPVGWAPGCRMVAPWRIPMGKIAGELLFVSRKKMLWSDKLLGANKAFLWFNSLGL